MATKIAYIPGNYPANALAALSGAALVLPGLFHAPAQAADDDEVDFQYSHYQEGKRDIYGMVDHDNDRCEAGSRVVPRSDRAVRFHVRAEGAE
jgi:hypothetical protein